MFSGQNFSYAIDADHKFIMISEGMREIYPHLRCGQVCHQAIYESSAPCDVCPLTQHRNQELTVFNPALDKWVNVICTDMEWPGSTGCTLLACSVINDAKAGVMRRIPQMAGYDVFFEMNITRNQFRRFFKSADVGSTDYEEEPLDALLERTCEAFVHDLDQERFREFWDMSTMMERLHAADGTLHEEFVERGSRGGWDLVHATVVPDVSVNGQEEIVLAMYTVIRSPQLAQLAVSATVSDKSRRRSERHGAASGRLVSPEDFYALLGKRIKSEKPASHAVVRFDVENFRFFNRWVGREAGDDLIEAFANELLTLESDYNILPCRLFDENFAFIIPADYDLADQLAERLRGVLRTATDDMDFRLRIGACLVSDSDAKAEDVLDGARLAARKSLVGEGLGMTWHDEEINRESDQRWRSLSEIRKALSQDQFVPFFQPKCHIETGEVIGAEALARWIHPVRGVVGPGAFVPLLEESGEIARLDCVIWEKTFAAIRTWTDAGLSVPPVSVNVSRYDVVSLDVVAEMASLAEKYGVSPHMVEIELTESVLAEDAQEVTDAIDRLRANGFTVLIDDFGSGYSSLNLLKDIPADTLKLDLKFLDFTRGNTSKGVAIIRSIIEMAHTLGIPVVIEGVETQRQVDTLIQLGCTYAQGYLFYKPLPGETFEELLHSPSVITEGVCSHYAKNNGARTELIQSEFDDVMLNSLASPMVMYELDGEDINIVKFNEPFSSIIGADELLRRRFAIQNYIMPDDLPKVYGAMKRAATNPTKTVRCCADFITEEGSTVPFVISFNFASEQDGRFYFLGLPNVLEQSAADTLGSKMQVIDRHWLNSLVALGALEEDLVDDVLGSIALYFLKDGEVYLKGASDALLKLFGETPDALTDAASRDVLKCVHADDAEALVDAFDAAIDAGGGCVTHAARFLNRVKGTFLSCRMGIHFVREYDGGYEFLAAVSL